jgi:NADH-quinone oxidoreductase subunit K
VISPTHYLLVSAVLFTTGLVTVVVRRQALPQLIGIQVMLQATTLALAALTSWFQDWSGETAVFVLLTIAAVELAVGIGIVSTPTPGS